MTSIAHPVLPGAVPAVGGSSTSSDSIERRRFQPAGSKAVRVGLGVAIAAVMAGDVYAVLRSPVAEGRGAGSTAASSAALEDGSGAAGRFASTAGHVAMNPFSDTAYGAALVGPGAGGPVVARSAAPAVAATPAATISLPAAPMPAPAARIVLPTAPASPAFTPSTFDPAETQGSPKGDGEPSGGETTPDPSVLAPVVDPLVAVIATLPLGDQVAPVVTGVVESVPTEAVAPVAPSVEVLPAPTTVTSSLLGR